MLKPFFFSLNQRSSFHLSGSSGTQVLDPYRTCPIPLHYTYHIMIWTSFMVASLRASKNSRRIRPFSPIFPMTRPKATQNTISPKTLIPSEYVPMIWYSLVIFCQERRQRTDSFSSPRPGQEAALTTTLADSKDPLMSCANVFYRITAQWPMATYDSWCTPMHLDQTSVARCRNMKRKVRQTDQQGRTVKIKVFMLMVVNVRRNRCE